MTRRWLPPLLVCLITNPAWAQHDGGLPFDTPVFGRTYGTSFSGAPRSGPAGTYAIVRPASPPPQRHLCGVITDGHFEPKAVGLFDAFGVGETELIMAFGQGSIQHRDLNCEVIATQFVSDAGQVSDALWFGDGWLLQRETAFSADFAFLPADGGALSPWVPKSTRRTRGAVARDGALAIFVWINFLPATDAFVEWFDPRDGGTTAAHQFPLVDVVLDYPPEIHMTQAEVFAVWVGQAGKRMRRFQHGGVLLDSADLILSPGPLVATATDLFLIRAGGTTVKQVGPSLGFPAPGVSSANAGGEWYFIGQPPRFGVSNNQSPVTVAVDDQLNAIGAPTTFYERFDDQRLPVVARSGDQLLVAWSGNRDGQRNIIVRVFSRDGVQLGPTTSIPYESASRDEGVGLVALKNGGLIFEPDARRARPMRIVDGGVEVGAPFYPPLPYHSLSGVGGENVGWLLGSISLGGMLGLAPVSPDGGVGTVFPVLADFASDISMHHVGDDFHVFAFRTYLVMALADGGIGGGYSSVALTSHAGATPTVVAQFNPDDSYLGATRTKLWFSSRDGGLSATPYDGGVVEHFADAWPFGGGQTFLNSRVFESEGSRLMLAIEVDGGRWVWKSIFDDGGIFISEGAPAKTPSWNFGQAVAKLPDGGLASVATRFSPQPNGLDIVERGSLYLSSANVPFNGGAPLPDGESGLTIFQVCGCQTSEMIAPVLVLVVLRLRRSTRRSANSARAW